MYLIISTDKELLLATQDGDYNAFKEFVKRHEKRVASTVIGMLGVCPEADDVGQETFIRFFKALYSFRGDSEALTYLTRIAINLSLNELKRRKRRNFLFPKSSDDVKDIIGPSVDVEKLEVREIIQVGINKLEPKFKSVIILRLIDGYSTKETADILKLPEGTVLSRLARAQKKLKEILQPIYGEKNE